MYKKTLSLILVFGLFFSLAVNVNAVNLSNNIKEFNKGRVIVEDNDILILPNKNIVEKDEYSQESNVLLSTPSTEPSAIEPFAGTYYLYARDSLPYNDGEVYSTFSSTLEDWFTGSKVNGTSRVAWTGMNPFNCDEIKLTDTIKLTGIGISLSIGSSGWSVTGGTTSKTATWSKQYSNEWHIDHQYSNITFDGVDLYYRQTCTGDFTFGTSNYTTNATDSVWP